MSGGSSLAADEGGIKGHAKKAPPANLPDMNGHWTIITHADGFDATGVLDLHQNGKKVTGTLTNEEQPPGSFKAKFIKAKAGEKTGTLKGHAENFVLDSNKIEMIMTVIDAAFDGTFRTKTGEVRMDGNKQN
jgi:hypothetical protein